MLKCKSASELVSQSLDRQLTRSERFDLRFHLFICKYCNQFNQQLQAIRIALTKANEAVENDVSITMPSDTKKRLLQSIETSFK